jgi:hypothetical protein
MELGTTFALNLTSSATVTIGFLLFVCHIVVIMTGLVIVAAGRLAFLTLRAILGPSEKTVS